MNFDEILDDLVPNPAIAAKERVRKILEQQAEDVLNGTSSVPFAREKKSKSTKADYNKKTYEHYKNLGYEVHRVDYYDARFQRQHDLLGFADMMALKPGSPPLLIQLTSRDNISSRVKKIKELKSHRTWLQTGGQIHVIGWHKLANGRFEPKTIPIELT
jgi:hypothetical protein